MMKQEHWIHAAKWRNFTPLQIDPNKYSGKIRTSKTPYEVENHITKKMIDDPKIAKRIVAKVNYSKLSWWGPLIDEKFDWEKTDAVKLQKHVLEGHMKAENLFEWGIPRFDLELLRMLRIDCDELAYRIMLKWYATDWEIARMLEKDKINPIQENVEEYRRKIVRTLEYMDFLEIAKTSWDSQGFIWAKKQKETERWDLSEEEKDLSFFICVEEE